MRYFSSLPVSLATAAVFLSTASSAPAPPSTACPKGLNDLMRANGKLYFGTAAHQDHFNDSKWLSIVDNRHDFGQITPEDSQKWINNEPERGVFNFTLADLNVNHALAHGQILRCHTLVWYNRLPDWLTSQTWDKPTLLSILEHYIETVVTHFRGRCHSWDVVNEAVGDEGDGYRETIWYKTIGPEYIDLAFNLTAKYDPDAKLYYNDYGIEFMNNKTAAAIELVKGLRQRGVKVDGVGLQAHFPVIQAPTYEQQVEALQAFASLGVEVAVTELDVFVQLPNTAEQTARQAQIYADTVRACVDVEKCVGVTVWGFYDPYSWVLDAVGGVPGFGDADLWWANYTKKPAYYAISDELDKGN